MTAESPLGRLIGTWGFEASRDGGFLGRGSTTLEWIEEGAFVLQRAQDEPDPATSSDWSENTPMPVTSILGFDDTTRRAGDAVLRRPRRVPDLPDDA